MKWVMRLGKKRTQKNKHIYCNIDEEPRRENIDTETRSKTCGLAWYEQYNVPLGTKAARYTVLPLLLSSNLP